jgi:hypothetical protein
LATIAIAEIVKSYPIIAEKGWELILKLFKNSNNDLKKSAKSTLISKESVFLRVFLHNEWFFTKLIDDFTVFENK